MEWSPQQDRALQNIGRWLKLPVSEAPLYKMFGFAGTGKTTLLKHIANNEDFNIKYAAYTGKAAQVMARAGCIGASTIHRLIYKMQPKSKANLSQWEELLIRLQATYKAAPSSTLLKEITELTKQIADERDALSQPGFRLKEGPYTNPETGESDYEDGPWGADLIAIDECSMVDAQMAHDLMSFGKKIIVLGDPAQLPPIASAGFFITGKPNTMLTEIHRQAADNPIIHMATLVREGNALPLGKYGESEVVTKQQSDPGRYMAADQILVGMNITRKAFNKRMRERMGRQGPLPEEGDKLICIRNNHKAQLLNGSLWEVVEMIPAHGGTHGICLFTLQSLDEPNRGVLKTEAWADYFVSMEIPDFYDAMDYDSFEYGYAITVHKSQGSQWSDVLLMDEWKRANRKEWLYTGITRAAERITVVKP